MKIVYVICGHNIAVRRKAWVRIEPLLKRW